MLQAVSRADEPNRRALLVAVNGYTHGTDYDAKPLNTTPDVMALKSVLMAKWGFRESDIKILQTPVETTHKSIMTWFRKFLVDPTTKPGDIIYFHYSGHGGTIKDPNRDGGFDQTLVTSDYNTTNANNDIRGREITPLLLELEKPEHAPASITLSFDSCHSGSITRGIAPVREYDRKADGAAPLPADPEKLAGGVFDPGLAARRGYLIISACRSDELSQETLDDNGHYMGSLSYALSQAFNEANKTSTYHQIMDRVSSIMRAHGLTQEPQVEGNWEKTLFDGKLAPPDHTLVVDLDHDTREPVLLAGFPMGITTGSKYNLYRKDTDPKTAPPIATAVVSHVDATQAQLACELKDNIANSDLRDATAVITERSYTPHVMTVDLSAVASHAQFKAILDEMDKASKETDMKAATTGFEHKYDLRVLPVEIAAKESAALKSAIGDNPPPGSLVIERADGTLLRPAGKDAASPAIPNDGSLASQISRLVYSYVLWRTVNDLRNPDGDAVANIEVLYVPCEVDKSTKRVIRDLPQPSNAGHQLAFKLGAIMYVMVRNTGQKPAYVTILDLQSDGIVNAMWPTPKDQTSNLVPNDGVWHKTLTYPDDHTPVWATIGKPIGPESVVAIATLEPSNFCFLDNTARSRGGHVPDDPLSRFLNHATSGQRGPSYGVPKAGYNVFGFSYTILP